MKSRQVTGTREIHAGTGEARLDEATRQRARWLGRQARGRRILDLGCGEGLVAILLAREGHQVLGIDIDAKAIEAAQHSRSAEAASVRERVRFEVADLVSEDAHRELLRVGGGSDTASGGEDPEGWDTVILGHVLEEFLRPEPVLALATELLAPDGRLLVSVDFMPAAPSTQPRHGFLVSELVPLLARYVEVESLDLVSDFILVAGKRLEKSTERAEGPLSKALIRWLEREERELGNRLRTSYRAVESLRSDLAEAREAQRRLQAARPAPQPVAGADGEGWKEDLETLRTQLDEVSEAREVLKAGYAKLQDRSRRLERQVETLGRELSRSVSQSAIRFKIGTAMFDASRSWKAALALPVTLYRLLALHRKRQRRLPERGERPGRLPASPGSLAAAEAAETPPLAVEPLERLDDVVVFLAINGGGLGHLTRCLAVARKLERRSPSTRIVFFTTSSAIGTIEGFGFEAYYFPPKVFRPDQTVVGWNSYFARSLENLLSIYHPSVLVFDGVAPYWAIVEVLERHPEIQAAWISRGNWKDPEDHRARLERYEHLFDVLVLPGEALADAEPIDAPWADRLLQVPPILLLDRWDLLPRDEAARDLRLPSDGVNVLIQLGAGNINDLTGPVARAVRGVRAVHPEARLVVAESLIAQDRQVVPEGVTVVKEYPLSRYLRAFDLLVSASGYNSFSEAVAFGVPTIFLPNTTAITDDQVSRATRAEAAGVAVVVNPFDDERFEEAVRRLTTPEAAAEIRSASERLVAVGGSDRAARALAGLLPERFRTAAALVGLAASVREEREPAAEAAEPIRVATVLDEFSFRCMAPEARMKNLHAERWAEELEDFDPQLLLVESAWRGEGESWNQRLLSNVEDRTIHELVAACRERGVPTVFWNKDDPPHFETFLDTARQFDVVFTSASTCVPRYREALGHDRVHALPFAAQPRIHNPIGSRRKRSAVGFAGSWHQQYPDRQRQMEYILQPAFAHGLTIFDRMHGQERASRLFPPVYRPYIRGSLPYHRLTEEYKHFEVFLNVNSVTDDPTMCARRVFEVLASGTPVVSGPAAAIENLLSGLVALSSRREDTERFLDELLGSPERRERLEHLAARTVLTRHTYRARFGEILERVGMPRESLAPERVAVVVMGREPHWAPIHRASLERQESVPDEIVVLASGEPARAAWRTEIEALPGDLASRVTLLEIGAEDDPTEPALGAAGASRWALWADGHAYGRHYLGDLQLAADYSFAQVVGKSVYHALVVGSLERRGVGREAAELEYGADVLLATSLIDRSVIERTGLPGADLADATSADHGIDAGETFVYAADRFSYLRIEDRRPSAEVLERMLDKVEVDDRAGWAAGNGDRERG